VTHAYTYIYPRSHAHNQSVILTQIFQNAVK